ncbi:MAG: hypothetical protein ACRD0P_12760 [Stackebrandtia sp.]
MTVPVLLASVEDLEVLMAEPLVSAQRDRAAKLLELVSAEARAVVGRDLTPAQAPAAVASVVLKACERWLRNPQGLTTERLGDYGRGFDAAGGEAGAYLTDGERAALRESAAPTGLVSVPTYRDVHHEATVYKPDTTGADAVAWLDTEEA